MGFIMSWLFVDDGVTDPRVVERRERIERVAEPALEWSARNLPTIDEILDKVRRTVRGEPVARTPMTELFELLGEYYEFVQ